MCFSIAILSIAVANDRCEREEKECERSGSNGSAAERINSRRNRSYIAAAS